MVGDSDSGKRIPLVIHKNSCLRSGGECSDSKSWMNETRHRSISTPLAFKDSLSCCRYLISSSPIVRLIYQMTTRKIGASLLVHPLRIVFVP